MSTGALQRLLAALSEGGATARKAERLVGDKYYDAATTPGFFQKGPQFARGDDALGAQFGVTFDRSLGQGGAFVWPQGGISRGPATMNEFSFQELADHGLTPNLSSKDMARLPHGKDTSLVEFDTSQLGAKTGEGGGGEGRGVYQALFGSLLSNPKLLNVTSSLTGRNQHRRNYNQAAALLRDPGLSRQILVDPMQLKSVPDPVDPLEFLGRAPADQVGALQSEGALQTLRRIQNTAKHPETYDDRRGGIQSIADFTIPFEEDPMEFARAADKLRRSGAPSLAYDTVGASALRRAAIVDDIINGRSIRKSLLPGLEYRQGGRVQGR